MIRMTKENKDDIFDRNKEIIDIIYELNAGMILHSQLITLAEEMRIGTTSKIKKSILELIKGELVKKKQVLNTNNNMLLLSSFTLARLEGVKSANAPEIASSTKSILENICRTELKINTLKQYRSQYKVVDELSVEQVKDIFYRLNSTVCTPLRDINDYIKALNEKYEDSLTQDFRDELTVLQVIKAQKVNNLAKYNPVEIDPDDLLVKERFDEYKALYRGSSVQENFFNFSSVKNSSCDIERFKVKNGRIEAMLAVYQTRNGDLERACEIIAWTYLALSRYSNLNEDPMLYATIYLVDEETTEMYEDEANRLAEFNYGYRGATKIVECLKRNGVRFPQCTDNIDIAFVNLHIADNYHISF